MIFGYRYNQDWMGLADFFAYRYGRTFSFGPFLLLLLAGGGGGCCGSLEFGVIEKEDEELEELRN